MDFKLLLEISSLLIGLLVFVYKLAQAEARIFDAIDDMGDDTTKQINELDIRLRVHIAECNHKNKDFNYTLRLLKERMEDEEP